MRAVSALLAVLALGTWAILAPEAPLSPSDPPPGRAPGPDGRSATDATAQHASRVVALDPTRSLPQASATAHTPAQAASVPGQLARPARLPPALELVSLPTVPGAKAAPPRSISRAEAVASVIGSPEFQETVSPLARLYLATFGRYPDYEGLNYYTGQREEARPLHEIAAEFVGSREFELRYGTLDNAQFVELVFNNVLGHPSQADVRAHWIGELDSGRMTRGQVLVDLAESGYFRERSAHQVFVSTAYTEILRRTPDPAGYAYWVSQLQSGQPYGTVINGLLGGP